MPDNKDKPAMLKSIENLGKIPEVAIKLNKDYKTVVKIYDKSVGTAKKMAELGETLLKKINEKDVEIKVEATTNETMSKPKLTFADIPIGGIFKTRGIDGNQKKLSENSAECCHTEPTTDTLGNFKK